VRNGYSTREAAEFVGLPESAIRSCVRSGFVNPDASGVSMRFSFRDLLVLQAVKALIADGIPLRRLRRQLAALHQRLPDSSSLAELSLAVHAGHVIVREYRAPWRAAQDPARRVAGRGRRRSRRCGGTCRRRADRGRTR